jgi:hypothetical protein
MIISAAPRAERQRRARQTIEFAAKGSRTDRRGALLDPRQRDHEVFAGITIGSVAQRSSEAPVADDSIRGRLSGKRVTVTLLEIGSS